MSNGKLKFIGGIMGEKNKKWLDDGKDNSRNFPQGQRVYSPDGDSCQLTAQGGGWGAKTGLYMIKVPEATKQGYAVAEEGDSINLSVPNSKTRRGRVGKGAAQTLDTQTQQFTLQNKKIRRLTEIECERLQGFPDNWTEGISSSQRYKCLGNAVSVPIVKMIVEKLFTKEV